MVRHHNHNRGGGRRGSFRDGDEYVDSRRAERRHHSGGKPPRTPKTPKSTRREDKYDSLDDRNNDAGAGNKSFSSPRDRPPDDAEGYFVADDPPRPDQAVDELKNIGTEEITEYDASKFDDASRAAASGDYARRERKSSSGRKESNKSRKHRSDNSSYMGGKYDQRRIQKKHSDESDRIMVVSTQSHLTAPDFAKLRGLSSKNDRRGGDHKTMSKLDESYTEDQSAYYDEKSAYTGYTSNYSGYSDAYSRANYSDVMSKDTGLSGQSSFTGYRSRGTGLTNDYTRDDDTGYDTRFTGDSFSAYTDDFISMKEVKKEMKHWKKEELDQHIQLCDFSLLQKQLDKAVKKGMVGLEQMLNNSSGRDEFGANLVKQMEKALDIKKSKSPRGRGPRRREKWDEHLKALDRTEIAANESGLTSSASFTPSPEVVVDFDGDKEASAAAAADASTADANAADANAEDIADSVKATDTSETVSGISYDEPTCTEVDDAQGPVRPPTPPLPHKDGPDAAATSPRHTTPESQVMIKGGDMSVINPSAKEMDAQEYVRSTAKAVFDTLGTGVASFFSVADVAGDESVEVKARGFDENEAAEESENHSPNTLLKHPNPSKDYCDNESHTTTETLIKPSPSTESVLKEAKVSNRIYQGSPSGLPLAPKENAVRSDASSSDSATSSRKMKVITSTNGLRKGKQAAVRPKKTVTEWLAGVQYEKKAAGTKWVKSGNAKQHPAVHTKLPTSTGRVAIKSTRKSGLKTDDNGSAEVIFGDKGEPSVYIV